MLLLGRRRLVLFVVFVVLPLRLAAQPAARNTKRESVVEYKGNELRSARALLQRLQFYLAAAVTKQNFGLRAREGRSRVRGEEQQHTATATGGSGGGPRLTS